MAHWAFMFSHNYLSYLILMPDTVNDNRFGKFKCSEVILFIQKLKIIAHGNECN